MAAQWAIIIADIWQWTSLTFLIFLSGFSALPQQLVNAARVMGATPWQIFWRVQLPLLKPAIVIAVIIRSMEALKLFDPVVLLTFGGPGTSTQTVAYFLWEQVWVFNKFSFGAAASIVLLIMFSVLIYFGIYLLIRQRSAIAGENGMNGAALTMSPEQARARRMRRERVRRIVRHAILLAWTGFIVFPIFWMVSTSFKDSGEWVAWPPHWLPHAPTLHNYAQIFAFSSMDPSLSRQAAEQAFSIWKGLGDALLVCTSAALLALLLGTFLAYSISRFKVGGKYFRHTILTIRMIPPIVVAISILMYFAILIPYATSSAVRRCASACSIPTSG